MEKIAINIDERRNVEIKERIVRSLKEVNLSYKVECFNSADDILSFAPDILVGHINPVNSAVISNPPPSLKWFHAMSAGVDKIVSNLGESLAQHNIMLSNVKGIHNVAMREYVLSMILFFEKDMERWIVQKTKSEWNRAPLSCLSGKELLVYGVGNIGKEIGKIGSFLGMRVIGISNSGKQTDCFEKTYRSDMLNDCLKHADYIVITAPKTPKTEGVFGKEKLSYLKKEAVLINISRGELVDEQCLTNLLNEGRIRGAALDVFQQEPLPEASPLWHCQNLIITPHISGYFANGMALGIECFIDNLNHWCKTGALINEVCLDKGY